MKKRVFSGIKPSGDLHLGNYIGALSQWVAHQHEYDNIFCIVDLHAITVPQNPHRLQEQTKSIAAWYIAAGINPDESIMFVQSDNPDHTYLGWILNCFTGIGQLGRMTQYKDKKEKTEFVSVGLFDYPALMAADILLYDTQFVPVGEDQKQHIELTRDVAERINGQYGHIFTIPEYMPPIAGERIMSLQQPDKKMSKSESDPNGTINLSDTPDQIREKLRIAVTDSGNEIIIDKKNKPAITNLITIYQALSGKTPQQLDAEYSGKGYKIFKQDLGEVIIQHLSPIQTRYSEIIHSKAIEKTLTNGANKAKEISTTKIQQVRNVIGISQ
ncbi:tryptophan--tRNA ligase [candidate division WWE3 bacterium]|nr:tryptophan--tRNA ligase [candidate division WWE3 bacterium]